MLCSNQDCYTHYASHYNIRSIIFTFTFPQLCTLTIYNPTICGHPKEHGFPFVFPCHCHLWLAHSGSIFTDFSKDAVWQRLQWNYTYYNIYVKPLIPIFLKEGLKEDRVGHRSNLLSVLHAAQGTGYYPRGGDRRKKEGGGRRHWWNDQEHLIKAAELKCIDVLHQLWLSSIGLALQALPQTLGLPPNTLNK